MLLKKFLDNVNYNISYGQSFDWKAYGDNARYMDCQNIIDSNQVISCVFDTKKLIVYEITIYKINSFIRWIDPLYLKNIKNEYKNKGINFNSALDNSLWYNINSEQDILMEVRDTFRCYGHNKFNTP